jgi:DNA polymerase-1
MKSKKDLNDKFISFLDQIDDSHKNDKLNLNDKVLIIDGLNTFIRSFSVNPAINEDGVHIGGIAGFLKSIRYTLSVIKPTRCIITFDGKDGSKRRRKMFPEYKENRKVKKRLNRNVDWGTAPADEQESMKLQMGRLVEYLEYLPLTLVSIDGLEADDVMAYVSKQFLSESKIVLMSTDKDFLQLVDDRISVWSPTKKILYTPDKVKEEYGIPSKNLLTYRILDGDKSDNINGIRGAGLKTIIKHIPQIAEDEEFNAKDLLNFVNNSDSKIKLLENIKNSSNLIKRNYLLMQLSKVDIPNHTKRKITDSIRRDIPELVKYKLQTMIMKDKLYSNISDFGNWVKEFIRLNHLKGLNRDGE